MNINGIVGMVFDRVERAKAGSDGMNDQIEFYVDGKRRFVMRHKPECCECVEIEDINGDLAWLVGTPILAAEESSNENRNDDADKLDGWTFYRITTYLGTVVIRWHGSSNGYYSVGVDFDEVRP